MTNKPKKDASSMWMSKRSRRNIHTFLRRVHLYLGLTLVPWVLLYGSTALMFNHGDWFTERTYSNLPPTDMSTLPSPNDIAQAALHEIGQEQLELVKGSAQWTGTLSLRGTDPDHRISANVHPMGHGGSLRAYPQEAPGPEWSDALNDWSPLSTAQQEALAARILEAVQETRPSVATLKIRSFPPLQFQVHDGNDVYNIEYELGDGMEARSAELGTPLRNKLLRLHVMHGDPGYKGVRWLWIRIVDVMGAAMILWGLTGLVMWWTLRPTRRTGAIALSIGVGAMMVLATSLWAAMGMH